MKHPLASLAAAFLIVAGMQGAAAQPAANPGDPPSESGRPPGHPALASPPSLGFVAGTDLFKQCADDSATGTSYCFAYLAAVHDSVRAYESWLGFREFCTSNRLTQSDLRDLFLKDARRYPFELRGQAASVVVSSLKRAYPCAGMPPSAPRPGESSSPDD
ncbi:hypothetical protein B2G71_05990 [Novosphingobium sp. PC22D]|uniref:Rap1a/Tai family immunity protein n=1 Tax=Novosphingobium sp. PC22D TaxID=1962403 RepID=UPI000BF02CAE|nr:Rap1a/Tai family immunity protein [Novosphingobium sp. PC22D]PEQ13853.1 hypothetical protein B2G71_05990 [Novosphingobium sp. PC22D]